ncbi:hypothetical protein B0H34DRAFT_792911 [Crassisporium funariophilum]|nr:hypothetical protein B0H34DRAFT_792911 [Crassisporium funariophilum]
MTASVEQQKQLYAQQLAAHTLRQWNAVRENTSSPDKRSGKSKTTTPENERDKHTDENDSGDSDNNGKVTPGSRRNGRKAFESSKAGVQVVDFGARSSPKPKQHTTRNIERSK